MNATEAINKIASLLNLNSKVEKFMVTKLEDGTTEVSNNKEGDFMIDDTLYIVQESTLKPAPEGTHTTREGLKLYVDSASKIVKIESASSVGESETEVEVETTSDMMSSSVLSDGTKIETDEDGEFNFDDTFEAIFSDPVVYAKGLCGTGTFGTIIRKQEKTSEWFKEYLTDLIFSVKILKSKP